MGKEDEDFLLFAKDSPVLKRLVEEVENEATEIVNYNRMHNRHNRSGGGYWRQTRKN